VIRVCREDLVTADVECLVRSVSCTLEPLTSLDGRVGAAAGEEVQERIDQIGELPVGGAVITPAGELAASFIVHVALQSYEEPVSLTGVRRALLNALRSAGRLGIDTLALAPLGTGAGNLDTEAAADVMLEVIGEHANEQEHPKEVVIMVANDYDRDVFTSRLQ
jgi:O-acetyl-ADP-ribose deacetylase (regulator of RNase III)